MLLMSVKELESGRAEIGIALGMPEHGGAYMITVADARDDGNVPPGAMEKVARIVKALDGKACAVVSLEVGPRPYCALLRALRAHALRAHPTTASCAGPWLHLAA